MSVLFVFNLDAPVEVVEFFHKISHIQLFAQKFDIVIDSFFVKPYLLAEKGTSFSLLVLFAYFEILFHRIVTLLCGVANHFDYELWC